MEKRCMGYPSKPFIFEGREAIIVYPEERTGNSYLAVKTKNWRAFPDAIELPLLENGFHRCCKNNGR